MPVSCKLRDGKWRIVGPDGKIEKNRKGTAVDGGGHSTREKCQKQARAINANNEVNDMAEKYECECIDCGYSQKTEEHCDKLKCPECGGQMRRKGRPGPGKNTAPINACVFEHGAEVTFTDDEAGDDRFSIVAYSGGIIAGHWFWGDVAFDLAGTKFDKKRTAVLEEHFSANRIGFTTKQDTEERIYVEGRFLSNERAQAVKKDIKDGFPMQASVFIVPSEIEHVKEGDEAEVNGLKLKGPSTVFRRAKIREVSMCSLGADSRTQSKAFAGGGKDQIQFNLTRKDEIMAKSDSKTIEELDAGQFAADYPELYGQVTEAARAEGKAEGEAEQVGRFKSIVEVCEDDYEMAAALFVEGKDRNGALEARNKKLSGQVKEQAEAAKLAAKTASKKVDPAVAEFSDDAADQQKKDEKPKTDEERFTEEFNADAKLAAEFGGADGLADYIAYRKADEQGLVHIAGGR